MKNNFIKQTTTYIAAIAVTLGAVSCSKLDEQVYGSKSVATASTGTATADLNSVYGQLNQLSGQYGWHALQVHSTDELQDQLVVLTGMTLVLGEKSTYMQQMVRTIKFLILGMD